MTGPLAEIQQLHDDMHKDFCLLRVKHLWIGLIDLEQMVPCQSGCGSFLHVFRDILQDLFYIIYHCDHYFTMVSKIQYHSQILVFFYIGFCDGGLLPKCIVQ